MKEIFGYDYDKFFELPIEMQLKIIEADARRRTCKTIIESHNRKVDEYNHLPWYKRIFKARPKLFIPF